LRGRAGAQAEQPDRGDQEDGSGAHRGPADLREVRDLQPHVAEVLAVHEPSGSVEVHVEALAGKACQPVSLGAGSARHTLQPIPIERRDAMELEGKVALVTGASGGIGAAVARELHHAGASVGLLSRRGDDLGLERGLGLACDVRDRAAVGDATEAVVARFGRLDIVVANAGVGAYGPFLDLDPDQLEAMIDVNLKGTLYTAAATLPHLVAGGGGDFVALASVAGLRAFPGEAVYNASKFGQVGFTRALDHELREHGVRATCICPGGVKTDFAIGTGREQGDPELEGLLTADEVADVVLFTVTRPKRMRILTTSFRPMTEASWG
jgi:NADP-dependent 3-hydroxy acid dehydrogenase YdfG